jgi:predicted nucleic acid-binding protein
MAALVDTNVVLDMLAKREPFYKSASDLLFLCAQGKCKLALSGSTVTDLFYLINKHEFHNTARSREIIFKLLEFFSVIDVGFYECCVALTSDVSDYEDAVLVEACKRAKLDCIITRNQSDFANAGISVLSPEEYLQQLLS